MDRLKCGSKYSKLWEMFDRTDEVTDSGVRTASCRLCGKDYRYNSSGNLRAHLRKVHHEAYLIVQEIPREKRSTVWSYFDKTDPGSATCLLCHASYKYGTSTGNLVKHLRKKHKEILYMDKSGFMQLPPKRSASDEETQETPRRTTRKLTSDSESSSHDDSDDNLPDDNDSDSDSPPDVWTYFEKESMDRARCVICRQTLGRNTASLTDHMKEKHAKLAVDTNLNNGEQNSRNSYTEFVYLEEESIQSQKPEKLIKTEKSKKRKSSIQKPVELEYLTTPVQKPSLEPIIDQDIDLFGKYVTSLLKNVPKNACMKMQAEIINFIVTEKLKATKETKDTASQSCGVGDVILTASDNPIIFLASPDAQTTEISTTN